MLIFPLCEKCMFWGNWAKWTTSNIQQAQTWKFGNLFKTFQLEYFQNII